MTALETLRRMLAEGSLGDWLVMATSAAFAIVVKVSPVASDTRWR